MTGWLRGCLALLLPRSERDLVLRELDDLHARRIERNGFLRSEVWYLSALTAFAFRFGVESVRRRIGAIGPLLRELSFSVRVLLRRPGYLVSALLTIGIGIGGVATVFSAANWVLLRDVPGVKSPDELVWIRLESESDSDWGRITWGISDPDFRALRERMPSLTAFEASAEHDVHFALPNGPPPARLTASMVTPGYFRMLRISLPLGRFFDPSQHQGVAGPAEVVIGHSLWLRYWKGHRDVIGAPVEVNGQRYSVVGVAPKGFRGAELPGKSDLWLASSAVEDLRPAEGSKALTLRHQQLWNRLIGRRQSEAAAKHVEDEANAAMEGIRSEFAGQWHSFLASHFVFRVYEGIGLDPWIRPAVERTLALLAGASGLLLLLAVANAANLGLTRVASRRGVIAIRRALGASRWRVAREPLLEGLVLGLAGAGLGMGVVLLGERIFGTARLAARGASLEGMVLDARVIGFTVAVAIVAGILSGLAPALTMGKDRVLNWLTGDRGDGCATARARSGLVVAQVALSATLLVTAGLFARTVLNLNRIDLGYPQDGFTFSIDPGLNGYDTAQSQRLLASINQGLREALGTQAVGLVFPPLLKGYRITSTVRHPGSSREEAWSGSGYWTSGNGLLHGLGLALAAGNGFQQDLREEGSARRPILINESLASAVFPGADPAAAVGRRLVVNRDKFESTVVGVVADARLISPRIEAAGMVFKEYDADWAQGSATFYARSSLPPGEVARRVRQSVRALDPALPVYDMSTVRQLVANRLVSERVVARLAVGLGLIGLLLASIGLYGVLGYVVNERTREIGVRTALGASPSVILRRVLGKGVGLTGLGVVLALPLAWLATGLIESRLYGVEALDLVAYGLGIGILTLVSFVASWIPAWRATRISPVEALRRI